MIDSIREYAIIMLDPNGVVESWNGGAERIKGYRASEIIGQHFSRFYLDEDVRAGKPARVLESAAREGRYEDESWRVRKDGSRFWANVVIAAVRGPGGELLGFAKVTRDLTERREAEEQRLRLAHAEEAIRLRDEFLSIASHELKTPLTALHLQLQTLRRFLASAEPAVTSRLEQAMRSTDRLSALIGELVDVSRISIGRFELVRSSFPLKDAVRSAVERLEASAVAARCPVTVALESDVTGSWDRRRVEQVVTNLLANAMKYGAGTPIEILVTSGEGEGVLVVSDGGPGIPDEALDRVFDRFERAVPMHNYGGLGLGLYVSREIVNAHGGSITAQNVPGAGARFTVRLPVAAAP